jgi:hypothetical protein
VNAIVFRKRDYPHWTVEHGMSGFFAVNFWWKPRQGFPEPWTTGHGRHPTYAEAADEARYFAEQDGEPFYENEGLKNANP